MTDQAKPLSEAEEREWRESSNTVWTFGKMWRIWATLDAERKKRAEVEREHSQFRARVFTMRCREGASDHSTACTIWGDDGQGGTREGFKEPLPCGCGALRNFEACRRETAEAEVVKLREALERFKREGMYLAEAIVDHYRVGIAHEIGVSNLPLAQAQIEKMLANAINAALERKGEKP